MSAVVDQDLLTDVQYAVLEPPDGGLTWPSGRWTRDEVLVYLHQAQNDLLRETACLLTRATLVTIPNVSRVPLPQNWIITQRVAWVVPAVLSASGTAIISLPRSDEFEIDTLLPDWEYHTEQRPSVYTDTETPVPQLQLAPKASDTGQVDLLYVGSLAAPTGDGNLLTIPEEIVPYLKYRILHLMLTKIGRGWDPDRAAYCWSRWQEGLEGMRALLRGWILAPAGTGGKG